MAIKNPYTNYAAQSLDTATPEELTLKLYEGALKFCNQAIVAIENENNEKAHQLIVRVQDIIREFQITLNMAYAVSKNLATMYEYIYRRLIEANINKDKEILEEIRELLRSLRDTWKQAMLLSRKQ